MKKIIQSALVVAALFLIGEAASAQTSNSSTDNTKVKVSYEQVKGQKPAASDKVDLPLNENVKKASDTPQPLHAPEHPGNKTRAEAQRIMEENKKQSDATPKK